MLQDKRKKMIDYAGISLLGVFSLCYCVLENIFAELNIQLNFLDFPIFVGEILFFICLILLILKWTVIHQKFGFWHYVIFIYSLFVLCKANSGYFVWGPLALRHSALFYYPLFAFFSFNFFREEYFRNQFNIIFILILLYLTMVFTINSSYKFNGFILAIILIKAYPQQLIKYLILSFFLIFAPYKSFLGGKRTMWVSNIVSGMVFIVMLIFVLKIKRSHRLVLYGILCLLFTIGLIKFADKNALSTIINLKENFSRFKVVNDIVLAQKEDFIMTKLGKPRLYNKGIDAEPPVEAPVKRILEESFQKQQEEFHKFIQPLPQLLTLNKQPASLTEEIQPLQSTKLEQQIQPSASQPEISPQPTSLIEEIPSLPLQPKVYQPETSVQPEPIPQLAFLPKETQGQGQPIESIKLEQHILPSVSQSEIPPQPTSLVKEIQPQLPQPPELEQHILPSAYQPEISPQPTFLLEEIKFQPLEPIQLEFSQPKLFALLQSTDLEIGFDEFAFYESSIFSPHLLGFNLQPIEQKTKNLEKLDTSYLNNFFRIFIWKDLLEELWRDLLEEVWIEKPFFGFDFGKPFRSKSVEILNIAHGEWTRDGWLAIHNSYLEMIYRAGIVGIFLIIAIFVIFFKMIKISISLRLVKGILLCAVLLNWLVSASFMPVLELPYKAIPFWSCFGMVLRYLKNYKKTRDKKLSLA